jgi:S-adenosylmethionine/arginine decarboxylase-like enzyme
MQTPKFKNKKPHGKELILDLYDCDPKIVRSKIKILEYVDKICKLIKMKKYGKAVIKNERSQRLFLQENL